MKEFTSQQKEVIARKLGYDGPMAGFDEFISSSPALSMKYAAISDKFAERMARGGVVRRKYYVDGGTTTTAPAADPYADLYQSVLNRTPDQGGLEYWRQQFGAEIDEAERNQFIAAAQPELQSRATPAPTPAPTAAPAPAPTAAPEPAPTETTTGNVVYANAGKPELATASPAATVSQITTAPAQQIDTKDRAESTTEAKTQQATAKLAATPQTVTAAQTSTERAAADVKSALSGVTAAQGEVGEQSLVTAEQMDPTTTALMGIEAVQGTARQVEGAPTRTLGAEEVVSGTAVDRARIEEALTGVETVQGTVKEEMTVQGQLNKLMTDFEANNPPPWAAANLRAVSAQLAARGLGASSLAGQALIQATLESAIPIASADAAAFQAMEAQNLSNRQQKAMLVAQQRAAFLGQEFDQTFQTRVLNAAKVSDVANMNFTAQQQIALENARMAHTMDLTNLSNQQAVIMAQAAQLATLEVANLNNRQQAAVSNAQAFLQMDLTNLSNRQQTTLFKAQAHIQSILSDTSAENAARQFNAASKNQVSQFNASLATQVSQFNAAQSNAISQFNADQTNTLAKFNAEQTNMREQFNATQRLVVDQANAQWEKEIATINTAATNAANLQSAVLSTNLTIAEYNNEVQLYRDQINQVWQSAENDAQRATSLAASEISANAAITSATISSAADVEEARIRASAAIQAGEEAADARESEAWGKIAGAVISYFMSSFYFHAVNHISVKRGSRLASWNTHRT